MKIFKALAALFVLALLFTGCPSAVSTAKSDAKSLVSFKFEATKNVGVLTADAAATYDDATSSWKVGPLPAGTNVGALVATFELSPLASASVGGTAQVSGTTANNFASASGVTYTVTAEDGSTATYKIVVSVTVASSGKDITAFALMIGSTLKSATITGTAINLTVPNGTIVTNLVATFVLSDPTYAVARVNGATQTSATSGNDFSAGVHYIVTAQDTSAQDYTVTVTVLPVSKLIITEYFEGPAGSGNSKYLELTNTDSVAVDLSAFGLRAYTNGSTTPAAALPLTGSLAPGKSVVYVASDYPPATLDTVAAMSQTVGDANGWVVPVLYVAGSTSISFNGNDAMELLRATDTMDFIGVYGVDTNWGLDVKMIRKPGKVGTQSLTYSQADWLTVPSTGITTASDNTAGSYAEVFSGSTLDEFWLGGAKGSIVGSTITVVVNQGTALTALVPNFITSAESVKYGGAELVAGVSTVDISGLSPTAVMSPVAGNQYAAIFDLSTVSPASSTSYTVNFVVSSAQVYTPTNYNFDGGIQAVYTAISGYTAGVTNNLDGSGMNTNWSRMYNTYQSSSNGILVNGAAAIGDLTIAIDGLDDSLSPIKAGCTFKITGETGGPTHTITATTTTAGKTTGLTFTTAIASAIADNTAITVTAYAANFANAATSGATTITQPMLDSARPIVAGDIFYISGETGSPRHRVTSTTVDGTGNTATISFEPALASAVTAYTAAVKTYINFVMNQVVNEGTDFTLTGIVTAVPSTGQIYIQDMNAAICLYKSSGFPSVKLGDKITISNCRAGVLYSGLAEVSVFGAPAVLSSTAINPTIATVSSANPIYYLDATTWTGIKDLKTRRYNGTLTSPAVAATANPYAGVFDATGNNQAFRSFSTTMAANFTTALITGVKDFYGVIDVYSGTSYMLLLTTDQVR